jgi:phosphatidate cytidylyltransferase
MSEAHDSNRAEKHESQGIDKSIDRLERKRDAREPLRVAGRLRSQKVRGGAEKFLTRSTSGAIYAIIVFICTFLGIEATAIMIAAMAWLCCSEFFRMCRMAGRMPSEVLGLGAAILYPIGVLINGYQSLVVVTIILCVCVAVWYVITPRASIGDVAVTIFGPIYTSFLFSSIVFIRRADPGIEGALLTFGTMGSIWLNDAFAYLVGSRVGHHKMAPRISPNKSWEGMWGGMVGSMVVWILISVLNIMDVSLPLAIITALLSGATGVIGDLFESRIKRGVGVKDSGNIMPGHGGLLDRSDSMLFGATAVYIVLFIGGIV